MEKSLSFISWGREDLKGKDRKLAEDIEKFAAELIKIQAQRQSQNGFVYRRIQSGRKNLRHCFHLKKLRIKKRQSGMSRKIWKVPRIMDRIVCGDVGYGKTEVAMRAAFKAIENNKQVALIAPTTVLAEQHYKRFCQRFSDYPVTIENLSRLTQGKSKEILKKLKSGIVDMVIGTHRLLSDDVEFKNVGLLIIDEEQKFGVKAKETLKKKRRNSMFLHLPPLLFREL